MAPRSRSTSRIADNGADAPVIQRNSLLAKLPEDELESLLDRGKLVTANLREIFFETGDPIEQVYFPVTGMCSLVTVLRDGTSLEGMTVGREGFVGLPLFHGIKTNRSKGMCQIEGDFYVIPAGAFVKVLATGPDIPPLWRGGHPRCRRSQESVVRMLRDHSQYGSRAILLIPEQS